MAELLSPLAQALLTHLGSKRLHDEVEVSKIESSFPTSDRSEIIRALRELSEREYGRLIIGRQGYETRFTLSSLGKNAHQSSNREPGADDKVNEAGPDDTLMAEHVFILRKNPLVRVSLPSDLTAHEADRLSNWAKTLPLD